jgi:hypothetical protein
MQSEDTKAYKELTQAHKGLKAYKAHMEITSINVSGQS